MKYENFVIRNAKKIILATIVLIALCIFPILNIKVNSDLESYIPEDMESRVNMNKIAAVFGTYENLLILIQNDDVLDFQSVEQISKISQELEQLDGISSIYSLYNAKNIKGEEGSLVVENLLSSDQESEYSKESIRQKIISNDLVYKVLVSEDFRSSLILLYSDKSSNDEALIHSIHEVIKENPGNSKISISGMPYLREQASKKITADLLLLLPLGLLVMFLFLWLSFRQLRAVLLPLTVVFISILVALALIPVFGWKLGLIGILLPIMMIAISNNYGIHVLSKYQEEVSLNPEKTTGEIIKKTMFYLKKPVILTGLTTMAGVLGLVSHILLPAAQMGVVATISIGLALLLSISFIPAVLSLMKKIKVQDIKKVRMILHLQKLPEFLSKMVTGHPKTVIVSFSLFFLMACTGLGWFEVAVDSNKVLPSKHPFNVANAIVDQQFGGAKILQIMFRGDILDPGLMKKIDSLSYKIKQIEGVGSVNSIATVVKQISMALNAKNDSGYNRIPDQYETIAQYIELYTMSGDPETFETMVDFNYEHALITVQYNASSMMSLNKIIDKIKHIVQNEDQFVLTGGYSLVDKTLNESVFTGQNYSLIFAFIAILILLTLIFKSFYAGILGSLPLMFSVFVTFGLMGWLGIELNIVTALLSSISIGLGVDFTIHMFWRLKAEIEAGKTMEQAIRISLKTAGKSITINAISVMAGFSVLFFSSFPMIHSFAFLIILSIFLCLICALLLIPSICLLLRPAFLLPPKLPGQNIENHILKK